MFTELGSGRLPLLLLHPGSSQMSSARTWSSPVKGSLALCCRVAAEAARDPQRSLPAVDELMTWEPLAWFVHKADRFEMPEDRRRLGAGELAALSGAADSREGNSFLEQVEASGVFQAGLVCVVDVLPSWSRSGLCCGEQRTPSQQITEQDG